METHQVTWAQPRGTIFGKTPTRLVLALGPLLSILLLDYAKSTSWVAGPLIVPATVAILLAWSPLFFALPALLTQDARDAALDSWRGPLGSLLRGLVLIPYLACSAHSPIRSETWLSLLGLAAAVLATFALIL